MAEAIITNAAVVEASPIAEPRQTLGITLASLVLQHEADEIIPGLWLSGALPARSQETLSALKITHILSVIDRPVTIPPGTTMIHQHIPILDLPSEDLLSRFDTTTAFIKDALSQEGNRVLVHCLMGMSRSASVVAAYLVTTTKMNTDEAIKFIQERRPIVCPNAGFVRQLEVYERQLYAGSLKVEKKSGGISPRIRERMAIFSRQWSKSSSDPPNRMTTVVLHQSEPGVEVGSALIA